MAARGTVWLKRLGANRGGELQAGRFLANARVTVARIIAGWSEHLTAAAAGRHVLAIQDTTELTFANGDEARTALWHAGNPAFTQRKGRSSREECDTDGDRSA